MSAMVNGNSKYARKYLDGDAVYANGNTVGILVFETLSAAEQWADTWNDSRFVGDTKDLIVLQVIPIGRGKRIKWLANSIDTDSLDYFYENEKTTFRQEPPDRTMAYPGVHVLGEYEWA